MTLLVTIACLTVLGAYAAGRHSMRQASQTFHHQMDELASRERTAIIKGWNTAPATHDHGPTRKETHP